jgi:hypothetical protein
MAGVNNKIVTFWADVKDQSLQDSLLQQEVFSVFQNNNNNNLLTASRLSPGGSGYFTFELRQTY